MAIKGATRSKGKSEDNGIGQRNGRRRELAAREGTTRMGGEAGDNGNRRVVMRLSASSLYALCPQEPIGAKERGREERVNRSRRKIEPEQQKSTVRGSQNIRIQKSARTW